VFSVASAVKNRIIVPKLFHCSMVVSHPYLYGDHFVESPDMEKIYDGVVEPDANGEAGVGLPKWFDVVNRDFRYHLTNIGAFAPVYIANKIENGAFRIAGGVPGMEASWQVTGIRKDAWAEAHRTPVEEEKSFYIGGSLGLISNKQPRVRLRPMRGWQRFDGNSPSDREGRNQRKSRVL